MKALLDEQLSAAISELLRARNFDVIAVAERTDPVRRSDEQIMEVAAIEDRAVITNNVKDFRPIAAARIAAGAGHTGLILVPSSRARTAAVTHLLADALEAILAANPGGLADSERWLAPLP